MQRDRKPHWHTNAMVRVCVCKGRLKALVKERTVHGQRHKKGKCMRALLSWAPLWKGGNPHKCPDADWNLFKKLVIPTVSLLQTSKKNQVIPIFTLVCQRECAIGKSKIFKTDYVIFEDFILLTFSEVKFPTTQVIFTSRIWPYELLR